MSNQLAFKKLQQFLSQRIANELNIIDDSSQWRRNQFELASKKISEKIESSRLITDTERVNIGQNISHSTLERILKYGYHIPTNIDKRRLNTLNKLAIYLDHKDWEHFNKSYQPSHSIESIKKLIQAGNQAEFDTYSKLPIIDMSLLNDYYHIEGPAYNKIKNIVINLAKKNWTLNNHTNTSYFEILKIDLFDVTETEIQLTTNECWYIKWYDNETGEVIHLYNEHNVQLYVLELIDGKWKIKLNHYPANFN